MSYLLSAKLSRPLFKSGNFHPGERKKKPLLFFSWKTQLRKWKLSDENFLIMPWLNLQPKSTWLNLSVPCFITFFHFFSVMPPIRWQSLHLYSGIPSTLTCVCVCVQSCPTRCDTVDCILPGSSCPRSFSGKNTEVDCHFPPPGDLPAWGIKPVSWVYCIGIQVLYR